MLTLTRLRLKKEILRQIGRSIEEQNKEKVIVSYRAIEKTGIWVIAEFEVDILEPGIFVLKENDGVYERVGEFGGSEENPEEAIRFHFIDNIPSAPKELFQCFSPKGAPFVGGETRQF